MITQFDEPEPSEASPPKEVDSGPAVRVLIVADEPDVLWSAERTLRQEGYTTATAFDGASALRTAERLGPIGLLVTELYLSRISGVELALRLRQHEPDLKALYLIRRGDDLLTRHIAVLSPNEAFLETPCRPQALLDAAWSVLHHNQRREHNAT